MTQARWELFDIEIFQYLRQFPSYQFLWHASLILSLFLLGACQALTEDRSQNGITRQKIYLGTSLPLKGQEEANGKRMKTGLIAALEGKRVQHRAIALEFENDYYEPPAAKIATQKLLDRGIFIVVGSVGTPTAKVTLPLLKQANIPAVGFFTGANLLRQNIDQPIVNYRASYAQEIKTTVRLALEAGVTPDAICAYVEHDDYGMAGLTGLKSALARVGASPQLLERYNRVLNATGDPLARNNIGPIGVYKRNTPNVKPGYQSLKAWERRTGRPCQAIVTVGSYSNVARFVRHARQQGETWVVSAISGTGADDYRLDLEEYGVTDKIIMTQVVPLLDSNLPIIGDARQALGEEELGYVSLEGYIVGRMTLKILKDTPGKLTREKFMKQVRKSRFNLGGIDIDFTGENDNQGSDLVVASYLTPDGFRKLDLATFRAMLRE
jgi:ABC-type branched-subunit amino acid transport system substrate-binding protein